MMDEKTKNLILLFTDAELILQECKDLKANLSLELQAARDDRRAQYKEFQELMAEVRDTLHSIQARFMIDAQLLDLVRPDEAGEEKWQKSEGENNSSQSRMLRQFAKSTR